MGVSGDIGVRGRGVDGGVISIGVVMGENSTSNRNGDSLPSAVRLITEDPTKDRTTY